MNISYNWLKDLVETELSPQELAKKLTDVGLAVEGIHQFENDFVLDFDLTSNRPDCLSHLGVAREVSAITNSELLIANDLDQKPTKENQNLVTIQDSDLCHRFTARIIRNVKIGASPEWLVKRLEAVSERSINNVADITNYVMHEFGQPMHSFDLSKLKENRIVVRRARQGETIKTLDEIERRLDNSMLVIADAEKPSAIGGVMGGLYSGITEGTTDVLLEVAYFKRENIRQTSRKLNLSTEASYRFERGVDIENLVRASNRAAELICELASGEAGEFIDVYPTEFVPNLIESSDIQFAVKRLTGLEIEKSEILRILNALGVRTENESKIFIAPSWRHDLAIEEDLVEEAARIYGYDKIAEEIPPGAAAGEYQPTEARKKHLRKTLVGLGFDEAISYSFVDSKIDGKFELIPDLVHENLDEKFVTLKDSIIEGAVRMRPSLLSGLLDAVRTNFNHQKRDLKLFEAGKVFSASSKENDLPNEREVFAFVLTGSETFQNRAMAIRELNFYDAKGALEAAATALNLPELEFLAAEIKHLRKGQAAEIRLKGKSVGTVGRLNDEISAAYKFKQPVYVGEVDLQTLLEAWQQKIAYRSLPVYPSIVRDSSLLIKRNVTFAEIKKVVEDENFDLLSCLEFVDVYEGKGVADDERSITVRFEYRSDERTLIEEEVEKIHTAILENLAAKLGAKQRF